MEEQIKELSEKVDKLQATLDLMIERMSCAQSVKSTAPAVYTPTFTGGDLNSYIGGGPLSYPNNISKQ